jgi:hypothetical protein
MDLCFVLESVSAAPPSKRTLGYWSFPQSSPSLTIIGLPRIGLSSPLSLFYAEPLAVDLHLAQLPPGKLAFGSEPDRFMQQFESPCHLARGSGLPGFSDPAFACRLGELRVFGQALYRPQGLDQGSNHQRCEADTCCLTPATTEAAADSHGRILTEREIPSDTRINLLSYFVPKLFPSTCNAGVEQKLGRQNFY